jgi:23S rRNA pseudouridine2605 synthase
VPTEPAGERLQKILSTAGVASRRAAETLITQGRVTVNGTTILTLGTKADPAHDEIRVDGQRIHIATRRRYIVLHKPRGYMTTRNDPERRQTVFELLPEVREYIYPVGRLDYDSEGLLLLTNDGELAERLMHPRHEVEREYRVRVRGVPDDRAVERLRTGVVIEGQRTAPARVTLVDTGLGARGDQAVLSVVLHEGRTRQVRHMCEAVGHPVVRLRRVRIGPISDPDLRVGEHRDLTASEVVRLRRAAGLGTGASERAARPTTARPPDPDRAPRPRPRAPQHRAPAPAPPKAPSQAPSRATQQTDRAPARETRPSRPASRPTPPPRLRRPPR